MACDRLLQARFAAGQILLAGLGIGHQDLPAQRQQARFQLAPLLLQLSVPFGRGRLPLEPAEMLADLLPQVREPGQVVPGVLDAALGFAAPLLVFGNSGRFLEVAANLLGAGLDDLGDHALFDNRVAAGTESGAQEEIAHVLAAAAGAVQEVERDPVTRNLPLHGDFVVAGELPANPALRIVENQFDRGGAHRFAGGGAGKDHVRHRLTAQHLGRTFAHHPAHGIDDVRFTAAVGADDAGHVGRSVESGRIDERFEAGQPDGRQSHAQGTAFGCGGAAAGSDIEVPFMK